MFFRVILCTIPSLLLANAQTGYVIQTSAGSSFVGDGGSATSALLSQAEGIALDGAGNVYFADADDCRVRKITPSGFIQTVAGTGIAGFGGDGGPGAAAQLNHPYGIAVDKPGNLYIADLGNSRVRKLDPQGQITTVAGGGAIIPGGNGDSGQATSVKLLAPRNVALDGDGNLYISDFGAHRVLRVSAQGILTTVAGTGKAGSTGDGASASLAQLSSPAGLAADSSGNVYIADNGNNRIRRVAKNLITTVYLITGPTGLTLGSTGTLYVCAPAYFGSTSHSLGSGIMARDIAVDTAGNLFLTAAQFVRKFSILGQLTTIAGSGASVAYGGDGGPALSARLHGPSAVVQDDLGNRYISDTLNNRIRKINSAGTITTYAGTGEAGSKGDGASSLLAQLNSPRCLALDSGRNLYVADSGNNRVRKITPAGLIFNVVDQLNDPECIAVDASDNLYIAETGNNQIWKATPGGTPAPIIGALKPTALTLDQDGTVYIAESSRISKLSSTGTFTTVADGLNSPQGLAITGAGLLLFAETGNNRIRAVTAPNTLVTVAGTGGAGFAGDGGPSSLAQLSSPAGLWVDISGTLFVADSGNNRIRTLIPSTSAPIPIAVAQASIVNAASLAAGAVAPGEIVTIFGAGFDATATQVLFDSTPAKLFYVADSQINCQVPLEVIPGTTSAITINAGSIPVTSLTAAISTAAPGIFTVSQGTGQIVATNEDGTYNSVANSARRGSVVTLYATGDGLASLNVSLTIGGYAAALLYAGPAPGFPGLMQINARVPAGFLPPGNQTVVLAVGSAQSQTGVTLAVQ